MKTEVVVAGSMIALSISGFFSSQLNATITPLQHLDFGTIAITDNSFVSSILIDPAGNIQVIGGIAVIESGNQAVYELSDLPARRSINTSVNVINTQMIGQIASEETFTLSLITFSDTVVTDANGMALLRVGGRIDTSGSGINAFSDTTFESTIQITLDY